MVEIIVFGPLAGFLIAGLGARWTGHRAAAVMTCVLVSVSAALSGLMLAGHLGAGAAAPEDRVLAAWIHVGGFHADWGVRIDTLSVMMMAVVTWVSALVHVYSLGYMRTDPHRARFFSYLSLFTFMMLALVTADNFAQLFFGWEGVGLASYLLIGFWYARPAANAAAVKAFVVNRIGDFGLLLGIAAIFTVTGSLTYADVFARAPELAAQQMVFWGLDLPVLEVICLLLFAGAMGKSAQFLLHTWLPDAMEGPTPVSALIHAATMVTAGVFLVARCAPLFDHAPFAASAVVAVGGLTALFAATVALVQNDIKRVVAYSTCSQLGYMFVALGLGAYGAGMFHLFTHAFFKALLFLGAGSVIHAMGGEQDMRRMGGLAKMIPVTYLVMLAGTLALTGFPFTAGYFSKDAIIEAAYASSDPAAGFAFLATLLAALLTAFYAWRLMFMTFHGRTRTDEAHMSRVHESPYVMLAPLGLLSVGALLAGAGFEAAFWGPERAAFWGASLPGAAQLWERAHHAPLQVVLAPTVMMALGFALAWQLYVRRPHLPAALAQTHDIAYRFLLNAWYFDRVYNACIVRPVLGLARLLWKGGDGVLIDGLGPDGVAARALDASGGFVRLQTGYLYHYAFAMLIGVVLLLSWFLLGGG